MTKIQIESAGYNTVFTQNQISQLEFGHTVNFLFGITVCQRAVQEFVPLCNEKQIETAVLTTGRAGQSLLVES